jgi:hypothetical protein
MAFEFTSMRLTEALEKVRRQHPLQNRDPITVGPSLVDDVRKKLEQTEITQIPNLAFRFKVSQLLACIEIVAVDMNGETADKAAAVVRLRPRDQMKPRAWFKLVAIYPNPLLEILLREICEKSGFGGIENNPKISNRIFRWLFADNLPHGILKDYRSTEKINLDLYLSENFLKPDDALHQHTWKTLLTEGTNSDLCRQKSTRILWEFKNIQRLSDRIQIGQHYLNTLRGVQEWADSILEYIFEQFDKPANPEDTTQNTRFWFGVNEDAKHAFRRWLILREIESFFEGERADFWREYVGLSMVKDVQKILGGEGFMLDFGRFGVVEFKNVGNAAYVYSGDVFRKFWNRASFMDGPTSQFKDLIKTLRTSSLPGWDGRILHHHGWQEKAKYRIDILLAEK